MGMRSIYCPVLGAHVTQVTDLEGNVTRVICVEYETPDATCRLKRRTLEGGPLGQLLERVAKETLTSRGTLCEMRGAG
jgi:hypothetical protein